MAEPRLAQSNSENEDTPRKDPMSERPEPRREKLRTEREDPRLRRSMTDIVLLNRVKLRTLNAEPIYWAVRTETDAAMLAVP